MAHQSRWGDSRRYGCSGFLLVLILGVFLSLLGKNVGIGISARIPVNSMNLTVAASIGEKDKASQTMPSYTLGKLGGNKDPINYSTLLTIGPAEGAILVILGHQEGAPLVDLHLAFA